MSNIQFNLRVPQELKDKIEEASKKSGRSINAEAAFRLEESFAEKSAYPPGYIPGYDTGFRLDLEGTGLSKEDFGTYVSEVIKRDVYKVDKK